VLLLWEVFANTACSSWCPEPPSLPSWDKVPWAQYLGPVSHGAAMAPAASASFSMYWEVVGKLKDAEAKAVPQDEGRGNVK